MEEHYEILCYTTVSTKVKSKILENSCMINNVKEDTHYLFLLELLLIWRKDGLDNKCLFKNEQQETWAWACGLVINKVVDNPKVYGSKLNGDKKH